MTICIATICEKGQVIIVASDHMVTAGFLMLEFEHPGSKIELLTPACVGMTAGDALASTELFDICRAKVNQLSAPTIEIIANEIKEQFSCLRRRRAEERLLGPRGLTMRMFYVDGLMSKLHPEMAFGIDREITQSKFPIEVIIAGVDSSGAHIYGIDDPGIANIYDKLGYHAVGSGCRHALYAIIDGNHSIKRGLNETVYLVYEAKRRAQLAPGVGSDTQMAIITSKGVHSLTKKDIGHLASIYEKKIAPRLKDTEDEIATLKFNSGNDEHE